MSRRELVAGEWEVCNSPCPRKSDALHMRRRVGGRYTFRSLRTTDRAKAEQVVRDRNAEGSNPALSVQRASRATLVRDAIAAFLKEKLAQREAGKLSKARFEILRQKAGQVNRLMGATTLAEVVGPVVEEYKATRLEEGVKVITVHAEVLAVLRPALQLAKRVGRYPHDPMATCETFDREYSPGTRWVTREDAWRIVRAFERDDTLIGNNRAAMIAWYFGVGGRLAEGVRAERQDRMEIDVPEIGKAEVVHVRGSKTERSQRTYPITRAVADFVDYAFEHGKREGLMFAEWTNVHRDLREACAKLGLPKLSLNDLRRSCISWLCHEGIPEQRVADWLGNSAAMIRAVYAQHTPQTRAFAAVRGAADFLAPSKVVSLAERRKAKTA